MLITDISPVFYGVSYFKYNQNNSYAGILSEKSQYVYRFIVVEKGGFDIYFDNVRYTCSAGDLLYLTPGQRYRLVINNYELSLYSVYFDFVPFDKKRNTNGCVFTNEYDNSLCSKTQSFSDAVVFNKSGIISGVFEGNEIKRALLFEKNDYNRDLSGKAMIYNLLSQFSAGCQRSEVRNIRVEEIISYINLNPDKDLSADILSKKFSYHKNHINYLLKKGTGLSLSDYVRQVKIRYAKTLIVEGELPLSQVAAALGYYDYSHFYKAFIKETGLTPVQYGKSENGF